MTVGRAGSWGMVALLAAACSEKQDSSAVETDTDTDTDSDTDSDSDTDTDTDSDTDTDTDTDTDSDTDTTPSCIPAPSGLVGWWRAEKSAVDSVGSDDGVEAGATYAKGAVGMAFDLDGTATVGVSNTTGLVPSASFSLEAWILPGAANAVVVTYYEGGLDCISSVSNSDYVLMVDASGHAYFEVRDSDAGGPESGGQTLTGSVDLIDGAWHHIVAVRDVSGGDLVLYTDGVVDAEAKLDPGASGSMGDDDGTPDPVVIGAIYEGCTSTLHYYFDGEIDELSYYDVALTAKQAAALHAATDGKCPP